MDKILKGLEAIVKVPEDYAKERMQDIEKNALIKEPLPNNVFVFATGAKDVVDESKVQKIRSQFVQTMPVTAAKNTQEECSPISRDSTSNLTFAPVGGDGPSTSVGPNGKPVIGVPPFPEKRKAAESVIAIGGGDIGQQTSSQVNSAKRRKTSFKPPMKVQKPSIEVPSVDKFDDDDDDKWLSMAIFEDNGKLVTGEPRTPTIGEKSRYFTEQ